MAAHGRLCRLESGATAGRLLDAYDAGTDTWRVPFTGPFWDGVAHAHALGKRGAGRRVAIIDSACDMALPALHARVDSLIRVVPQPDGEDLSHGTAVALLVARVAPECRMDVYAVVRDDGRIDAADVAYAVSLAAASGADVINVSLGAERRVPDLAARLRAVDPELLQGYLGNPDTLSAKHALLEALAPDPQCELCDAATAAVQAGKMVFAAAGNDDTEIMCPARAVGVTAAGFQSEAREIVATGDGGATELVKAGGPHSPQSLGNDIALQEVDGVLGTSFASPLYAAAAALVLTPQEMQQYVGAVGPALFAATTMQALGAGPDVDKDQVEFARTQFIVAMQRLPHVHSGLESFLRGGEGVSDPAACASCGLFAEALYVNFGLFLLQSGRTREAASLLEAAVAFAPWNPHATANLGRTRQAQGQLEEALRLYDRALVLRPGFQVYAHQRATIAAMLGGGLSS